MFDDFIVRAFAAGIGLAFITGPLGCFIVWRRLSYFGDTIAHTALLGVVIAYALDFNIIIAVLVVSCLLALSLLFLQRRTNLPDDALLGLLAHSVLAIGLVLLGILSFIRIDLMGLLFGDILSVNVTDLLFVWIGGGIVLIVLILIWRPLFAGTVNLELAKAEGLNPDLANAIFTLLIASVIAISIKIVGILLITGLLIIPASASRNLSLHTNSNGNHILYYRCRFSSSWYSNLDDLEHPYWSYYFNNHFGCLYINSIATEKIANLEKKNRIVR